VRDVVSGNFLTDMILWSVCSFPGSLGGGPPDGSFCDVLIVVTFCVGVGWCRWSLNLSKMILDVESGFLLQICSY
jgi:hypothetical protein